MSPFRNILKLFAGDLTAKALNFLVFVYLARILGVTNYGTLEFAFSAVAYFLLIGSFGVEVWATREVAWGEDIRRLAGKTVLLRLIFSTISFAVLLAAYSYFPEYSGLKPLLLTLGASIFITALNLKWVFLGREQMARVAIGLIIGQAIFAGTVFIFVRDSSDVVLVAFLWLLGEVATAGYFAWLYFREYTLKGFQVSLSGLRGDIKPILTFGATQAMGLLSYNFDALVMGFLLGSDPVGLYRAAYKPITAALALPMTFFVGLFPALSRTHQSAPDDFRKIADRAQNLSSIFSVPFAIGGIFFAGPIILLLFGTEYARSAPVMQLLALALGITLLRGTYRNGLAAAGYQQLDLLSAGLAVSANLLLNIYFIPRLGMTGAALATIGSELTWLVTSRLYFTRKITKIGFGKHLVRPLIAGFLMVVAFYLAREVYWPIQATLGLVVYFGGLLILGEGEVRSWVVRIWPVSA